MFLRIEGFQVEIKEINKTWERPASIKNFKIGKCIFLTGWCSLKNQHHEVEKFSPLSPLLGSCLHTFASCRAKQHLQSGGSGAQHTLPREDSLQEQGGPEWRQQHHLSPHSQPQRLPQTRLHQRQPCSPPQSEDNPGHPGSGRPAEVMAGRKSDVIKWDRGKQSVIVTLWSTSKHPTDIWPNFQDY